MYVFPIALTLPQIAQSSSTLINYDFQSSIDERAMHLLRRTNLRNFRKLVENFIFVICREKGKDVQDILYT